MVEITRTGQSGEDSLNGKLAFEQGNNRIIGRDDNNVIRMSINADDDFSVDFYDSAGDLVSRYDSDGQKYYDSSGAVRALFDPSGIKIAKPTFDATTATSSQLIFNSAQNIIKVAQTGTVGLTLSGSGPASATAVVTHNLGYSPLVLGTITYPPSGNSEVVAFPGTLQQYFGGDFQTRAVFDYYATSTSALTISVRSDFFTAGDAFSVKYYLMQETAV